MVEAAGLVVDRGFHAWPFSAEYLSALFDYNVAPFFQSFVEVRVEPSAAASACCPTACTGDFSGRTSRTRRSPRVDSSMKMRSRNG